MGCIRFGRLATSFVAAWVTAGRGVRLIFQAAMCATWLSGAFAAPAAAEPSSFSMDDLEALSQSRSWLELLRHGADVKPAKRTGAWEKLIEKAAIGYFADLTDQDYRDGPLGPLAQISWLPKTYPHLSKSARFGEKRAEVAAKSFKKCLYGGWCASSEQEWYEKMESFVTDNPHDGAVPFALGKMIQDGHAAYASTWYFAEAVKAEARQSWCNDAALKKAVASSTKEKRMKYVNEIAAACRKAK